MVKVRTRKESEGVENERFSDIEVSGKGYGIESALLADVRARIG
jgi:hypothetical protein